ncbi:His-Xaa-Ser system protein HxsD [Magnetospirillum sp. 15-1]|uniref:His-Xaa-Ser system protein HxsD n=1 Tax=Magnetospirillum sp. 15-1 TaxID=1979370 RepID=UPI001F5BC82C|nr:His-Xaa-Ser system protein HxsD [Magnetospirillum sp. 15-1]
MGFPSSSGVVVDERGAAAVIALDPGLYSEDVALKAAYWLTDRCHVHVGRSQEGGLVAEIRTKDGREGLELTAACGEFCNALVDFALRARIAEETRGTQEALLQRAFVQLLPRAAGG